MRIAQVAPLAEAVPPKLYGGTERVVMANRSSSAEGHDVTLFASGDSEPRRELVPVRRRAYASWASAISSRATW